MTRSGLFVLWTTWAPCRGHWQKTGQPLGRLSRLASNYLAQSYFLSGHVPGLMGSALSRRINETVSDVGDGGWAGVGRVL